MCLQLSNQGKTPLAAREGQVSIPSKRTCLRITGGGYRKMDLDSVDPGWVLIACRSRELPGEASRADRWATLQVLVPGGPSGFA